MDLITVPWKFPFESGPKSTASPDLTVPELRMPSTTVPTYGTEYTSVIEYCSARQRRRDGVQERKKERRRYLEGLVGQELLVVALAGRE